MVTTPAPRPTQRRAPIGDLLRRLVGDVISLLLTELSLAGNEIGANAAGIGKALAAIVSGISILSVAMLCLLGALVAFLAQSVGIIAAALIVAVVAAVLGGILIAIGIARLKTVDLAPTRTIANLKRDVKTLKGD